MDNGYQQLIQMMMMNSREIETQIKKRIKLDKSSAQ